MWPPLTKRLSMIGSSIEMLRHWQQNVYFTVICFVIITTLRWCGILLERKMHKKKKKKIEKFQGSALNFVYNDFKASYGMLRERSGL